MSDDRRSVNAVQESDLQQHLAGGNVADVNVVVGNRPGSCNAGPLALETPVAGYNDECGPFVYTLCASNPRDFENACDTATMVEISDRRTAVAYFLSGRKINARLRFVCDRAIRVLHDAPPNETNGNKHMTRDQASVKTLALAFKNMDSH